MTSRNDPPVEGRTVSDVPDEPECDESEDDVSEESAEPSATERPDAWIADTSAAVGLMYWTPPEVCAYVSDAQPNASISARTNTTRRTLVDMETIFLTRATTLYFFRIIHSFSWAVVNSCFVACTIR